MERQHGAMPTLPTHPRNLFLLSVLAMLQRRASRRREGHLTA